MILCQKIEFFVAGAPEPFCWIFGRVGFALNFRVRLGRLHAINSLNTKEIKEIGNTEPTKKKEGRERKEWE